MSDSEHDEEFEAYLKRRVRINKGATPPSDPLEPPAELDRIVIGNARKAIRGAAPMPFYRSPKWALPVGLAATIVISLVVVLDLGLRVRHQKEADAVAREPVATDLYAEAPDTVAPAKSATNSPRPAATRRIKLPPIPTVPWPPAVTPNITLPTEAAEQPAADTSRTRLARAEVAAARSRSDMEPSGDPPPRAGVAPTPSAPTAGAYATAEKAAAEAAGTMLDEVVITRSRPTASPPPPASPRVAHSRSPMSGSAAGEHPDPASWLGQIEKLRNEGRTAEAEQEFKHFREVYPAYPTSFR